MLPKPEKNKKISVNAEQLSLVDPVKKENNLKKKRLYVGITLILTVSLSVSFSVYHYFKNNSLNIRLPSSVHTPNLKQDNINKSIDNLLSSEKNIWYVHAQDLNTSYSLDWPSDKVDFIPSSENILSSLTDIQQSSFNSHLLDGILPGGVTYVDNKTNSNSDLIYTSLLTVPQKQFFIYIKISNGTNSDPILVDKKIQTLVEKIYWHLINL